MSEATLAFVDTETTGLDPVRHEVWEVGLILRKPGQADEEYLWQLPVDLTRADVIALNIGRFHERRWDDITRDFPPGSVGRLAGSDMTLSGLMPVAEGAQRVVYPEEMPQWAENFMRLTWGAHLVGAVPDFDSRRLGDLLLRHGAVAGWHYHLVDVETLAVGYLAGHEGATVRPPWKSDDLATALGVTVAEVDRHTALGDARMARAIYDRVMA